MTTAEYTITLPWPENALSPNARTHWAVRSRAVKKYRSATFYLCRAAGLNTLSVNTLHVSMTFHPPHNRKYDDHNLVYRFKAGFDGIQDASGIDDRLFTWEKPILAEKVKGGCVVVKISHF